MAEPAGELFIKGGVALAEKGVIGEGLGKELSTSSPSLRGCKPLASKYPAAEDLLVLLVCAGLWDGNWDGSGVTWYVLPLMPGPLALGPCGPGGFPIIRGWPS